MEKENLHEGHRTRLREKACENGLHTFDEHQVLELLLSYIVPRKDTNPIAHRLIKEFGSLAGVLDAKEDDLAKINGIGERASAFLHLMPQFFKSYQQSKIKEKPFITNPAQVFNYLGEMIRLMPHEEFYMICLDSKSQVILSKLIAKGTNNQVNFNLKEITQIALQTSASGIILVHNHPTGSEEPSSEDIELTKKIYVALSLNGICVLDHLIISQTNYYSFTKNGLFKAFNTDLSSMLNIQALRERAPKYAA
ncbi:MAG: DNA repair protein RadC [Spirochaetales bacterium]